MYWSKHSLYGILCITLPSSINAQGTTHLSKGTAVVSEREGRKSLQLHKPETDQGEPKAEVTGGKQVKNLQGLAPHRMSEKGNRRR